jgi:hypothetical protein
MKNVPGFLAPVLLACTMSTMSFAAEQGSWTLMQAEEAGRVHFTVMQRRERGGTSRSGSDWPIDAFEGLDVATRARHDVMFTITRDAGRFDCEGYLVDGEGAGLFRFAPDPTFAREMRDLGFGGIDEDEQFAMALHDVSLQFARQMQGENLAEMDADKLIAFRIFGVSQEFIRDLRREGLTALDADELVAFRIHDVSPEFIAEIDRLGYANVDGDELVAMRIHGVTPQYISDMQARGLKDLSVDKLVALRIHGID